MNKVVLITGGARGIGRAIAVELAKNNYDIVINYLTSKQAAHELQELIINEYGVRCMSICADVADEIQVDKMISEIEDQMGSVDILINNAAVDLSNLFHLKTADEFRMTMDVNVVGAFNCSKRVYPKMLEKEYGRIINISSTNGINTYYPMCIDYDASKAALISLTHNLAFEFAPYVNVNCIAPGFIGTEDRSHSQISLGIRNSLNSGTDASCSLSYEKELDEIIEADDVSEDQLSDDQFILEFAKRCAKYPGRKPLLLDIEKVIPRSQRSRLPIILVILRSISLVTESSI